MTSDKADLALKELREQVLHVVLPILEQLYCDFPEWPISTANEFEEKFGVPTSPEIVVSMVIAHQVAVAIKK